MRRDRSAGVAVLAGALLLLTGCQSAPLLQHDPDRLSVVTTTGLLRDLVQQVGGEHVDVVSIVPDSADPHSYEPTLRDARNVVYADVAFSNYALLEQHSIIRTLDANLPAAATSVSLAEEAVKYAAELIPLVENVNLDTIWLGLRVHGTGAQHGADRTSQVRLSATDATGPGDVHAYLTGTFGDTDRYLDSTDGFDAANGYRDDQVALPADAHTHLSWAFTEPGLHTLDLAAALQVDDTARPVDVGTATFTFAVGVDPARAGTDRVVLDRGHADLTANLDTGALEVRYDPEGGGDPAQRSYAPEDVVIAVPARALDEVPAGAQFRFLGRPGTQLYQLPQAVLGKHVHGEIDPHLWQNARNGIAYAQLIRDTLIDADPANAADYHRAAAAYVDELAVIDEEVRQTLADIPAERRHLITTHDAFGYLAEAYGVQVAGFVSPNPAVEPSLADRRKLTETIRTLEVPAVFLEPNLAARSSTLTEVAAEQGIAICPIYGDTFDDTVSSYTELLRFNARSLHDCLTNS